MGRKVETSGRDREKELKQDSKIGKNSSNSSRIDKRNQNNHQLLKQKVNWLAILLISLVVAILPLIVRMYSYDPKLSHYVWYAQMEEIIDFFLYYKQWSFVTIVFFMFILILVRTHVHKIKFNFKLIFVPLGIYLLLVILSTIFSDNVIFSLQGSMEQFESMFALLGYGIVVVYAVEFLENEFDYIYILRFFAIGSLLLGLIGIGQTYGFDIFYTAFFQKLIIPRDLWELVGSFEATFGEGIAYMTLFNPNYVGVYVSLVIPIVFVLFLFNKKILLALLYIVTLICLSISMFGSGSTASIISIAISAFVLFILLWRYLFKWKIITIPLVIIGLIALFSTGLLTDKRIVEYVKDNLQFQKTDYKLQDITTYDDHVGITYKGNTLNIEFIYDQNEVASFRVTDGNGILINNELDQENSIFTITDDRFPGFSYAPVIYNSYLSFYVRIDESDWLFTNQTGDGSYYYHNRFGKLDKITTAPSAVFTGYEWLAGKRGYLWSRTLPLIKDNIFIGSGPDTFVLEFPQNDYLNFVNYQYTNQVVTKPHSLYLQIAVQTGLVSLIAFLTFYGMYFISSIKLFIRGRFNSVYAQAGLAIFVGTIGYMVSGIANDSSITTAPVFWALMGVGIAANYKAKPLIMEESAKAKEEKLTKKNKAETSAK